MCLLYKDKMAAVCVFLLLVLFVHLSEGACPDGWFRHGQMCYHFSTETEDWASAKIICEAMKGQLVEIETQEEGHFLGQQAKVFNKYYWTALTDLIEEDTWIWMNSLEHATYTNWKPGEPNNDSTENCVDIYPTGYWNDAPCKAYHNYICEKSDDIVAAFEVTGTCRCKNGHTALFVNNDISAGCCTLLAQCALFDRLFKS